MVEYARILYITLRLLIEDEVEYMFPMVLVLVSLVYFYNTLLKHSLYLYISFLCFLSITVVVCCSFSALSLPL